jgi:hypothetical protein
MDVSIAVPSNEGSSGGVGVESDNQGPTHR